MVGVGKNSVGLILKRGIYMRIGVKILKICESYYRENGVNYVNKIFKWCLIKNYVIYRLKYFSEMLSNINLAKFSVFMLIFLCFDYTLVKRIYIYANTQVPRFFSHFKTFL